MTVFDRSYKSEDLYNSGYINIKDHGFIVNNRTGALVGMDGTIDWACFPDFDSMPLFDSILDKERGGYFSIRPAEPFKVNQYYEDFTNILITEFIEKNKIVLKLTDFLPITEFANINFPEIHRYIETPSKDMDLKIEIKPDFNFGLGTYKIKHNKNGYIFQSKDNSVVVSTDLELNEDGKKVFSENLSLKKGSYQWIVISSGVKRIGNVMEYKPYDRLEATRNYWKEWTDQIKYSGIYYEYVLRSALVLKGLFYEPTGMMVAAPTTSLPESIGGTRNWDYRYTWVRDTAYVIETLSRIGLKDEATKFLYDVMSIIQKDKKVRTIYPVKEGTSLTEQAIDFSGYRNSRPVRIGNMASDQLQIDQYGSIVSAMFRFQEAGGLITTYMWDFVIDLLDTLKDIWKEPDSTIWEFRSEPKHYIYSKFISWTAFHRAILIGKKMGYSAPYSKWSDTMKEIKDEILEKGYNKELGAFTQYYGSKVLDASILRMPLTGFLPASDPRFLSTLKLIEKKLKNKDGLFLRYNSEDGIESKDNAFLLLSFWYIEDLILLGRIEEARGYMDDILNKSNHLMLFSEEINYKNSNEMLGNFPQALTHLGIIRSAIRLNDAMKKSNNKTMENMNK